MFGLGLGRMGLPARRLATIFSPASLFAAGEQGAWYDPSDLSTMFQDSAGTTPVTADGQPVGLILDKSGRGNHASQATAASRPLYKTDGTYHWLQGDGVDDQLSTAAINFSVTSAVTAHTGIRINSTSLELPWSLTQDPAATTGGLGLYASLQNVGDFAIGVRGGSSQSIVRTPAITVPKYAVVTSVVDLTKTPWSEVSSLHLNGAFINMLQYSGGNPGSGPFANDLFHLFRRGVGGFPSNSRIYSLIVRGVSSSAEEINNAFNWVAGKTEVVMYPPIVSMGDSTISEYSGYPSVASLISGVCPSEFAVPSATINDQIATWQLKSPKITAMQKAVVIQVGLNDLVYSEAASVALGRLQNLIDIVNADVSCPVVISQMSPCKSRLITLYGATNGAIAYQKWLDMNDAIAGIGANAITNVDGRVTSHVATLNDGSGNLAAAYDVGDGIHTNTLGRQVVADAWQSKLVSIGVLP